MKRNGILAALLVVAISGLVHAGGPPPMYVVVDKVVLEPSKRVPGWVQIWGCFTRSDKLRDGKDKSSVAFSKPVYGYVYLSIADAADRRFQEELQDWQKAAGTGKAVAIGACGDAGTMLKCPIHQARDTVSRPDAAYTVGHLKLFGDMYAHGEYNREPEVAALLKFAKERK